MSFVDDQTRRSVLKGLAQLATAGGAATGPADTRAGSASDRPTFASTTVIHVGEIGLRVRNLERMMTYYRDVIGLAVLAQTGTAAILGVPGVPLLALESRPDDRPDNARLAGLFHTAFLMPTRADLGRWLMHVAGNRIPVTGVADHLVSEAIYLDDPEGNGIEVYADRPVDGWAWDSGGVVMATEPLDIESIMAEGAADGRGWSGAAPAGLRIGHVHLRVGDVDEAERFYGNAIGFAVTRRLSGATFLSSGRYHHHLGANVWHSAGAGRRPEATSGLAFVGFKVTDAASLEEIGGRLVGLGHEVRADDGVLEVLDPWGMALRLAVE
jgi:catechol 2,3-dioxygenase